MGRPTVADIRALEQQLEETERRLEEAEKDNGRLRDELLVAQGRLLRLFYGEDAVGGAPSHDE